MKIEALTFDRALKTIWRAVRYNSRGLPLTVQVALGMVAHCKLQQANEVDTCISSFSVPVMKAPRPESLTKEEFLLAYSSIARVHDGGDTQQQAD